MLENLFDLVAGIPAAILDSPAATAITAAVYLVGILGAACLGRRIIRNR